MHVVHSVGLRILLVLGRHTLHGCQIYELGVESYYLYGTYKVRLVSDWEPAARNKGGIFHA